MATNSEFAQLSSAAYQDTGAPSGWARLDIPPPQNPVGYYGAAFKNNATGEIVIANRGTEITSSQDRAADLQMMTNQLPDQYQYAKQFYRDVLAASGDAPIAITGHSLGGTLAQLLAAESTQSGNPLLTATTFNPYGAKDLIPAINAQYGLSLDPNATYNNIVNHQTLLDGVSRLGSSSPLGSDQLGQMQTHVAVSELAAALMSASVPAAFPLAYLAVEFNWSHSIDRFTQEIYPQEALVAQVGQSFGDFVRTVNDQINAIEQAGATAQANLQNDFLQLAGTAGQTYQDAMDSTLAAMEQVAGALTAAEQSAVNTFLDFAFGLGNTISDAVPTFFTRATLLPAPRRDPLVLDLDGDGIESIGLNALTPLMFDITGSGVKTSVGWIKPDDGFLVLDRNANGTIDSGAELFGDATPLSAGGTASNGFTALTDLDTNLDGKISSADTQFANLRVWRDLNQDGISQSGELFTLSSLNISALNLAASHTTQVQGNGNTITDLGTQFGQATTRSAQLALLDNLLDAWADTSTLATTFEGAYAGHTLSVNIAGLATGSQAYLDWETRLSILERFSSGKGSFSKCAANIDWRLAA